MTRVAAVDCGTNSIRLLVADVDRSGSLADVARRMEVVRLGHGVDRTGAIAPEAMARTLARAGEYASQCEALGAQRVRFVATSASRDARNAGDFVAGVAEAFAAYGIAPEVISGAEEAALSFRGATGDLAAAGIPGPYLVVDLGGGSTELVRGTTAAGRRVTSGAGPSEAVPVESVSVDIGCVRLTERHLRSDPPTSHEVAAAEADIEAALDQAAAAVGLAGVSTLVGLAGSVTTVAAHAMRLGSYEADRIHLSRLPAADVEAACDDLLAMTRSRREALPYMHPGRVDVIGAGALIWRHVVARVAAASAIGPVVASEHDILDGIAIELALG